VTSGSEGEGILNKIATTDSFAAGSLASMLLLSVNICAAAASDKSSSASATDPRLDMVTALQARGPNPTLGDQAKIYDRLVGTWDVEYTDFSNDGKVTHRSGEFIVGWVMDGRAIQDFWIVYPSGTRKEREVYTDLRYYDPKSRTWPATFIDVEHASVARFTGGAVGDDRIVLDTRDFEIQTLGGQSTTYDPILLSGARRSPSTAARPGA
jgi:hypothetical protein